MIFRPIRDERLAAIEGLNTFPPNLVRNLGVMELTEEAEGWYNREENKIILGIKCFPTLSIYEGRDPIEYPPMIIVVKLNMDKYQSCTQPSAINAFSDHILEFFDSHCKTPKERRALADELFNTSALHPHVSRTGPCYGNGNGRYTLQNEKKVNNAGQIMTMILDLRRWASSVNLAGAYYMPSTYFKSVLSPENKDRMDIKSEAILASCFSQITNQEAACALSGYVKCAARGNLVTQVSRYINDNLTWEEQDNKESPMPVKNIDIKLTPDRIEAIMAIELVKRLKISSKNILPLAISNVGDYYEETTQEIFAIVGKEVGQRVIMNTVPYFRLLTQSPVEYNTAWPKDEPVLMDTHKLGWVLKSEEEWDTISSFINNDNVSIGNVKFDSVESILLAFSGKDSTYVEAAKTLIKMYFRIEELYLHNSRIYASQKERNLHASVQDYERNVGENPLLS